MISEVILPKLGQTMEYGAIVEWIKKEGDPVERDEVLFSVETDKAVFEVESPARGFLRRILIPAGQKVPVLTVVAAITTTADEGLEDWEDGSSSPTPGARPERSGTSGLQPSNLPTFQPSDPLLQPPASRLFASPRARKAARERGIDLAGIAGSGPGGRIVERDVPARPMATPMAARMAEALGVDVAAVTGTGVSGRVMKADVEAAAPVPPPATAAAAGTPVTGLRRIIAERMAASHHAAARVTLVTEVDATSLVDVRERLKADVAAEWGLTPGYNDLLGLIVARALRELPYMNARLSADGQAIEQAAEVNLGMAVDTDRGLLVPVIRQADQKGLRALATELRSLVDRARAGRSLPDDLSGGTFTITNLGMYDVDAFTPIINLPEAAILGVGRIQQKPVVRDGQVVARHMLTLSLAFDHRLVDGAPAARFLQRIKRLVENPYLLLG